MMKLRSIFVDTWGWVAYGHRRDDYHAAVVKVFQDLRSSNIPIHTSDYVLDEVITLLFKREVFAEAKIFLEGIFAAAELGQVQIHRITSDHFSAAWGLRKQFQDKPLISFTDLTSMVIMREYNVQDVLTQDDHFLQVNLGFFKIS